MVYLDLNHFILLARARKGTAPAGYARLLPAALGAAADGRALFPLSGEHVQEMWAIKDPRQRGDLAVVMESLSGLQYILGRPEIAQLEINAGFRAVYEEPPDLIPLPLVGPSFARAFGMAGGLRVEDETGKDVTQSVRLERGPHFDRWLAQANLAFERRILRGPSDAELVDLKTDPCYRPAVARASQQSRLDFELTLKERLGEKPSLRKGRLRDLVAAREVTHEWLDAINKVVGERALAHLPVPAHDEEELMKKVLTSMPHNEVAISLKTAYHRDPGHNWTVNDLADIDALSVAFTYCDAAFPDKATRAALASSAELRAIDTFLPRRPTELAEWLEALPTLSEPNLLVSGTSLTSPNPAPPS